MYGIYLSVTFHSLLDGQIADQSKGLLKALFESFVKRKLKISFEFFE